VNWGSYEDTLSSYLAKYPHSGDLFVVNLTGRFKGLPRFELSM